MSPSLKALDIAFCALFAAYAEDFGLVQQFYDLRIERLVGDKGYISKNLFQRLFVDGIQLITKLKTNMKGALMSVSDRLLLRKRAIIETVNDELKNIA
ncbi:transposase, partial [Alloprevotella tannerae]|uniref:transposase n=1 Tax=Alloprevotella tannerae TaxID=76122 RepID=UPI0036F1DF27